MAPTVAAWVHTYGYWAVLGLVLIESVGLPVPGEVTLITAAAYAGTTGALFVGYVIAFAAIGAIVGAELAYVLGHRAGPRLLRRYRWLDEGKLDRARQLVKRYGWPVVLMGRFVVLLRSLLGWLAGINRMDWRVFLAANAAGAVVWATAYGMLGWALGSAAHRFADWGGLILAGIALLAAAGLFLRGWRRRQRTW